MRERRNELLAEAIEDRCRGLRGVSASDKSVFVKVKKCHNMDDVCAVAYDHGYVPLGFALAEYSDRNDLMARFKPRDSDEVNV